MNENFTSQVSEKSDKELLDIYKRPEEYQDAYIDLVEKELQKRKANHEQIKVELNRIKSENARRRICRCAGRRPSRRGRAKSPRSAGRAVTVPAESLAS